MAMFGSLGFPELIFIFLLALLIFGPKKLPELGRTLGKAMAEFRKATTDLKRTINAELIEQELREADPRKIVRDSLREAKTSLENAVRLDEERAAAGKAAATAPIATAATAAAAFADVAEAGDAAGQPAAGQPTAPRFPIAGDPGVRADPAPSAESAPDAPSPVAAEDKAAAPQETPSYGPAGAVARGARFDDDDDPAEPSEPPPKAPQPAPSS